MNTFSISCRSVFFIGILLISSRLFAQREFELAGLSYTNTPGSQLSEPLLGAEDFTIQSRDVDFFLTLPIPLSKKWILTTGLIYQLNNFSYENEDFQPDENTPDQIHTIQLNTQLTYVISPKWNATLLFNPNLSSDFIEPISGDDLFNQVGFVVGKPLNKKTSIGLGIISSFVFGKQLTFPILMFNHLSEDEKFYLDITFPLIRTYYALSSSFRAGFFIKFRGNQFNFRNLPIDDNGRTTDFIQFSEILLGPEFTFAVSDQLLWRVHAGWNTGRRFEVFDNSRTRITDITSKSNVFVSTGLFFRVKAG